MMGSSLQLHLPRMKMTSEELYNNDIHHSTELSSQSLNLPIAYCCLTFVQSDIGNLQIMYLIINHLSFMTSCSVQLKM